MTRVGPSATGMPPAARQGCEPLYLRATFAGVSDVPQYSNALQLRPASDRRGDSRGEPSVRSQVERLYEAVEGERGCLQPRDRRNRRNRAAADRLDEHAGAAAGSGRVGRQGEGPRGGTVWDLELRSLKFEVPLRASARRAAVRALVAGA